MLTTATLNYRIQTAMVKAEGVWMFTNAALNFRKEDSVGQSRGGGGRGGGANQCCIELQD